MSAMVRWEFFYVDLFLGRDSTVDSIGAAMVNIAAYGRDGWEPVGEIEFEYQEPGRVSATHVRALMLKRPLDTS